MIENYQLRIENKFRKFEWLFIEHQLNINKISDEMLILKGRIVFLDFSVLEFSELYSREHHDFDFILWTPITK